MSNTDWFVLLMVLVAAVSLYVDYKTKGKE